MTGTAHKQHTIGRLFYRHITGLEYDGRPRTDAGWTQRGTKALALHGRALRWNYRPRLQRAAIRWAWTAVAGTEVYGMATAPTAAEVGAATIAAGLTAHTGYRVTRATLGWQHRRRVVRPLAAALSRPLEIAPVTVEEGLSVPLRTERDDARVVVPVPDGWHGDRSIVEGIVSTRLGGDWAATWRMLRSPFSVEFTRAPAPPEAVSAADVRDLIDETPEGKVFLGLGTGGTPIYADFRDATPHIGLSCGTGAGKSVLIRGIVAQVAARGGRVVIIDPKIRSLNCFEGVPGITIHRFIEDQMQAIAEFRATMELGYATGDITAWGPEAEAALSGGPQSLLVLEEQNDFSVELRKWWADNKPKGAKGLPPTFGDVAKVLFKGRQLNANVLGVYQRLSVAATGLTEARDQFGCKILGRFSHQNWGSLVGTKPMPRSSDHPGRMIVVSGGRHRLVQVCYWTEEEAREYALAGRQPVSVDRSSAPQRPALSLVRTEKTEDSGPAQDTPAEPLWTLREACEAGLLPLEYSAAAKARQRTGTLYADGRKGNADAYTEATLQAWHAQHYATAGEAR
jgi:Type IV secretion-system coupling protein DNA-binding domain